MIIDLLIRPAIIIFVSRLLRHVTWEAIEDPTFMSRGSTKTCSGVVERGSVEPRGYVVDGICRIFQVRPNYPFGYEPIESVEPLDGDIPTSNETGMSDLVAGAVCGCKT